MLFLMAVVLAVFLLVGILVYLRLNSVGDLAVAAGKLGWSFQEIDEDLEERIRGVLPIFSKGKPECDDVISGKVGDAECSIFYYSYRRRRRGSESVSRPVGVMVCFYTEGKNYGERQFVDEELEWGVESNGSWVVLHPTCTSREYRLTARNLSHIQSVAIELFERFDKNPVEVAASGLRPTVASGYQI